jgi:hypothetical protein
MADQDIQLRSPGTNPQDISLSTPAPPAGGSQFINMSGSDMD